MDCLTLHPWWVPPIVAQAKPLENRNWHPPAPEEGYLWLGLHAGLGGSCRKPDRNAELEFIRDIWPEMPEACPTGVVVGAMKIVDVVDKLDRWAADDEWWVDNGEWASPAALARYAWIIGEVRPLPEPLPCKGREKLWTPPRDIELALERLVERAK